MLGISYICLRFCIFVCLVCYFLVKAKLLLFGDAQHILCKLALILPTYAEWCVHHRVYSTGTK